MAKTPEPETPALVTMNLKFPADLHRRLKIQAAMDDTSMQDMVIQAVTDYLDSY